MQYGQTQAPRLSQMSPQQRKSLVSLGGFFVGMVLLMGYGWKRL